MAGRKASNEGSTPVTQILVLQKALSILDSFTPGRPALELADIRRATGLPASTCLRLVRNLVAHDVLTYDGSRYRVGVAVLRWAKSAEAGFAVVDSVAPYVTRLRDQANETSGLFIRVGAERVCIAVAEATHSLMRRLYTGHALPLYVGSPGKVLLAYDDDALAELGDDLTPRTDHTITDRAALEKELAKIRSQGYAASLGEWEPDLAGVAAPVFGYDGAIVAAMAVSAPMSRLSPDRLPETAELVVRLAREASEALGHADP